MTCQSLGPADERRPNERAGALLSGRRSESSVSRFRHTSGGDTSFVGPAHSSLRYTSQTAEPKELTVMYPQTPGRRRAVGGLPVYRQTE